MPEQDLPTPPFRAAIFDMDGLLFDTEALGRWAWAQALTEFGYALTDELYQRFLGRDMNARRRILLDHFGADFPFEAAKTRRLALGDEREIGEGVPLKPGAAELLLALHAAGVPIALATGTERERALRRLRGAGLEHCFRGIVTSQDVAAGKPAPDIVLEAARRLGEPAQACVLFEDSWAGIEAGRRAGSHVVMVPDMEPVPEGAFRPDRVLASLLEARALVDGWFAEPRTA